MAIILECPNETSTVPGLEAARRRSPARCALRAAVVILMTVAIVPGHTAVAQNIHEQGTGTLEIPRAQPRQPGVGPRAAPLPIAPGENVLIIPQASRDFVGEWGGHLHLLRSLGGAPVSPDSIVSLAFGEREGNVFMHTTAFANPSSHVAQTTAKVVNPRSVRIKLQGQETAFRPPLRHVEELHLVLTKENTIDCLKYVDFYAPDSSEPVASMAYQGTLHPLTPAQREELAREVISKGQVPQKEIEGSRRFGP